MNRPFFITGLPRSRTAWLAAVTTTNESRCWHEPTCDMRSFDELYSWWTVPEREYRGVADSGLGMMLGRILERVQPRTLIVERPMSDVMRSMHRYLRRGGAGVSRVMMESRLKALQGILEKHRYHRLVRIVSYDDLTSIHVVCELLEWLVPHVIVPELRQLMHFNIQSDLRYSLERASSSTQWWMPQELRETA